MTLEANVGHCAVTEAGAAAAGQIADRTEHSQLRRFILRFFHGLRHHKFLSCCTPVAGLIPIKRHYPTKMLRLRKDPKFPKPSYPLPAS